MESIWVEAILILVAILANGVFAGSELALVSARVSRLVQLRDRGVRGAAAALRLKDDQEAFLATIQIAITTVGTLASAVGGAAAVRALTPVLAGVPGLERWAGTLALGLIVLVITYLSLVLGELTPKALALRDPELAACRLAPLVRVVQALARVPNRLLTGSTRLVLALLGRRDAPRAPLVSEEEVTYLVREGAAAGIFERMESELVHRVFRFTDTAVRAIMTPRPSILGLPLDTPPGEVLARAVEAGHSRLPVYRTTIDDVVGVVTIKDLLAAAARGEAPGLDRLLHPPLFVPEPAPVSRVLAEFQRRGLNLALIVDEHGRVTGLVTVEDIVEEIVGEIREERESPTVEGVRRLPDGAYLVEGTVTVRDLRERVGLPVPESADYQTVAGFLLHRLGTLPRPGTTLRADGHVWTVLDMDGPRIARVKAEPETR